jgi:uncharacterized protein (TIGR03067 family)
MTSRLKQTAWALASLFALTAVAAVPRGIGPDRSSNEVANLKGTWVRVVDGKSCVFTFNGSHFAEIIELPNGTSTTCGTITVSPTKIPKEMNWTFTGGTGPGTKLKGTVAQTIYSLAGDTFSFCAQRAGRPNHFPTKEGAFIGQKGAQEYIYFVMNRAKS